MLRTLLIVAGVVVASVLVMGIALLLSRWTAWTASYLGDSARGFRDPSRNPEISAAEAIRLAQPYLEESYRLRRQLRGGRVGRGELQVLDRLSCSGEWYYVTRDDYPSYSPGYYVYFAVKVNRRTGKVIPPDPRREV